MGTVLIGLVAALLAADVEAPVSAPAHPVFVSVKGDDPGFALHRRVYTPKPAGESVCVAPCDQPIAVTEHSHFFLTDSEQLASADFRLIEGEQVLLHARAGSRTALIAGRTLIGTGIGSLCVGVTALLAGLLSSLATDTGSTAPDTLVGLGVSSLVLGLAALIIGAVFDSMSAPRVTQTTDFPSASPPPR
jgi:hypothetical protein